jgi:sulfhydrogenase subunit beta (sulfur reductase)
MDSAVIGRVGLGALIDVLKDRGYTVIGPTVRDNAIVLAEIGSADELPFGVGVGLDAGRYRISQRRDNAAFAHSAGPQSWKAFLHPPRVRLWTTRRDGSEPASAGDSNNPEQPWSDVDRQEGRTFAFVGVRPCDLAAIGVLDAVLGAGKYPDETYTSRRDGVFVVAVECTEPGDTCFCASMGTGPGATEGYDLALTELVDEKSHRFVVRVGSEAGAQVLAALPSEPAEGATGAAQQAVAQAAKRMSRQMPAGIRDVLVGARESPHWDDVASRCLTCGNCTLVCPTCFCTTTEDVSDLTGEHAERWRRWDSCFDLDFSYIHGGSIRSSGASRYRQWMTHKLSTWHEQFGSSGCVGCGRCIVWCPVGIDITAEAATLAGAVSTAPPANRTAENKAGGSRREER